MAEAPKQGRLSTDGQLPSLPEDSSDLPRHSKPPDMAATPSASSKSREEGQDSTVPARTYSGPAAQALMIRCQCRRGGVGPLTPPERGEKRLREQV